MWYIYYSQSTGEITRIASLPQAIFSDEAVLEAQDLNPADVVLTHYVQNGILTAKPFEPPSYDRISEEVKAQRQSLLLASDWTQIPNHPLTAQKQQEWAVYRQQLRDITMQSGYPFTVIWPTPPQG